MRRSPLLLAALASLLGLPASALGHPAPAPSAARVGGRPSGGRAQAASSTAPVELRVDGGLFDRGHQYVARGQRVGVQGSVAPGTAGSSATVRVERDGRLVTRMSVSVAASGARGRFSASFSAARSGRYAVEAEVDPGDGNPPLAARPARFEAVSARARQGDRGLAVRLLQRGLRALAYATPASGRFDDATARAVLAFRKVNRMSRNGYASGAVFAKLLSGAGGFRLRYPGAGRHAEFDWSRQVLVLARAGRPERIYHASSGKPSTPTVFGTFTFYRREWGTNSHGMVNTVYFIRGYAVHGYASVPPYAASHGCIRVPIPDSRAIARRLDLGERIFVYR